MPSVLIRVKDILTKLYPITYWHSVHQQGQLSTILQLSSIYYTFLSGNYLLFHRFTRQHHLSNQFTKIRAQLPGNLQFRRPLLQSQVSIRSGKLTSTPECSTVRQNVLARLTGTSPRLHPIHCKA